MTTAHYDDAVVWKAALIGLAVIVLAFFLRGELRCRSVHGHYVRGLYKMECLT